MSKPLRRRRLGAAGSFLGGGGNPNEPPRDDEAEHHHHHHAHGVGPSSLLVPTSSSSSSSGVPLPLDALIMEEDAKVHDGPGMSFGATLRRTLTASVHSLRGTGPVGLGVGDIDSSHDRQAHAQQPAQHLYPGLTILDASIERRDWGAVLSIVNSPAGPSLSARTSHAPLFYGGRFGTTLLPLHRACMYDGPAYVIEALLKANPTAARTAESAFHRLPIHLACRSGSAQVDTVRMLLLASDRDGGAGTTSASRCRDRLKRIPLHYILANGAHPTIVDDLLQSDAASGRCLAMADSEGWSCLHVACGSGVDLSIVERLAREHPAAMNSLTRWGSRPLDCARMFVGDRYAERVDEIFCRNMNRPSEIRRDELKTINPSLGVIHEENIGPEGKWDGVSQPTTRVGRPTSRFAM